MLLLVYRKDSRYSEKDAAVVVRQMLKVAAECHLRGLVHRDMKPEVSLITSIIIFLMSKFVLLILSSPTEFSFQIN